MAEIKTRPIGKALFGVNFEPTGQAPLDARLVVENMETLLANETYVDRGNNFYEGMPVIVKQGKSGKSELWVLIDGTKVTEEAGWRRLDADGAAINGNIEDAINGLDSTVGTTTVDTDKHVAVEVAQVDGKLTKITVTEKDIASATELTNTIKKIGTGFDETNTVAKAFEKEASNRNDAIRNAINNLTKSDTAEVGKFVTAVSESNGIIEVTRGTVAANKVSATAITGTDTTVAVAGDNVAEQIASLGTALKTVEGNAAKYKVVKLSEQEVAALGDSANVREAYKVVSWTGDEAATTPTQVGEAIKIYKDAALLSVTPEDGVAGENTVIKFTYSLADGTQKEVSVDLGKAIFESEMGNGMQVVDHKIAIKLDAANENAFLTVGENGLKLSGVQNAIKKAVDDKNVTAEGDNYITATAANNKVTVRAGVQGLTVTPSAGGSTITGTAHSLVDGAEVANKVAAFTNARISEEIAKLDVSTIGADGKFITKVSEVDGKIAAEFAQVKANEVKLEQVKDADNSSIKLNATTVQEGFAELFGKMLDNEEVTAEAVNKIKTIFGITGEELKYEAKSDNTIIGNATSYSDADAKLAESIKSIQDNTVYDCGEF